MDVNTAKAIASEFRLKDMWRPRDVRDYKVHFARWNGEEYPLNVLARSLQEWKAWQEFYPSRNEFSRPYIFSLAQVHDEEDVWMFGGVWRVLGTEVREDGWKYYEVDLDNDLSALIGRLKLHRRHRQRGTRLNLENHYEEFVVREILSERYTGRPFPGYESVNVTFQELESLAANNRQDWVTALSNVKGVYLITDTNTKLRYVGSAYGDWGVWSRWMVYLKLGHGGNEGMRELLEGHDLDYCRSYFKFALLEHHDRRVADSIIIARENYWKEVLDTRNESIGLNRN